ncbi:hypothetical protein URH17368_1601 [Alicyclobacillus hesperidum URH17-3-68]|nr:hypothetical protein URH17368_1601 [Alicyclobacillus hesperidum URH17-3-68]
MHFLTGFDGFCDGLEKYVHDGFAILFGESGLISGFLN